MPDHARGLLAALLGLLASLGADRLTANDIQPRLFTNVPVGTNFVTFAYTRSEGPPPRFEGAGTPRRVSVFYNSALII